MHTSHVSTATRVYLCSAAVTEVQFLLTALITFTDLHNQVGLTQARCARACPTSTLLKNTLTPAQPRCVSALVLIYCTRLREPLEELMHADDAPCPHHRPPLIPKAACRASLRSYASRHTNTSKAMGRMGGKNRDDKTRGCEGKAHSDWCGEGELGEPRMEGQCVC